MSDAPLFFLQDSRSLVGENMMFWADGGGYTSDITRAEKFTMAAAQHQHNSRASDIPWPVNYIIGRVYAPVDMQNLRHVDKSARDVAFYRQLPGRYSGNDIIWESNDMGETTDLRLARVFPSLIPGAVMWQVEEIQKLFRLAVRAIDTNLKQALRGTGIVLVKPRKYRNPRHEIQCWKCGRFITERQVYADCPNCGAENRP